MIEKSEVGCQTQTDFNKGPSHQQQHLEFISVLLPAVHLMLLMMQCCFLHVPR